MDISLTMVTILQEEVIAFSGALPSACTPGSTEGKYVPNRVTTLGRTEALPVRGSGVLGGQELQLRSR